MVARDGWYQMADSVAGQIAARRGGVNTAAAEAGAHGLTFWVDGIGGSSRVAMGDGPGFSGSLGGVVAGVDKLVAPGMVAGLAIGGLSTETSSRDGSRASGQLGQFSIYGGWRSGIAFADAQAGFGAGGQDTRRNLSLWGATAKGGANIGTGGGQLHAGVHLETGDFAVEPVAGVSAANVSNSAVTESEAAALNERIAGVSTTSVRSQLGVRVGHGFTLPAGGQVTAQAFAGWDHEFGDRTIRQAAAFSVVGGGLTVSTAPESRDRARLGAGLSYALSKQFSIYGNYDAAVAASGTVQQLTVGARMSL